MEPHKRNIRKWIQLLLIVAAVVTLAPQNVSASNATVFEIENIEDDTTLSFQDNIYSEFRILDSGDGIVKIKTHLETNEATGDTGITYNLSNKVTYTVLVNRSTWLWIMPSQTITHYATISVFNGSETVNYTLFNDSQSLLNFVDWGITSTIEYDSGGWTTFRINTGMYGGGGGIISKGKLDPMYNTTNLYAGLPANKTIVTSLTPFDIEIKIVDVNKKIDIAKRKESLSWIAGIIYTVLNYAYKALTLNPWAESEELLTLLFAIDWIVFLLMLVFSAIYEYPYLIAYWILTMGNFYSGYLASSPKDVVQNMIRYYKHIFSAAYGIWLAAIDKVMWIFSLIRG